MKTSNAEAGQFTKMDSMMNAVSYFEIFSSNPSREIRFYESVFGWKFTRESSIPVEYYRIHTSGMHGGLLKRSEDSNSKPAEPHSFVCSMQVNSFDQVQEEIIRNGGQVTITKFAVPGRCWQGYFTDPDGNAFGIFEVDVNAR